VPWVAGQRHQPNDASRIYQLGAFPHGHVGPIPAHVFTTDFARTNNGARADFVTTTLRIDVFRQTDTSTVG